LYFYFKYILEHDFDFDFKSYYRGFSLSLAGAQGRTSGYRQRRLLGQFWQLDQDPAFVVLLFDQRHLYSCERSSNILTRNSSGDEIANVNILTEDIAHALQNTINSSINSATDRRRYVLERRFTKVSEITQCNGHYAVQGHSRSRLIIGQIFASERENPSKRTI